MAEEIQSITLPEVTDKIKAEVRTLLEEVELNNGHLAIAHTVGLARSQVKEIHQEMIAELNVDQEE
jgi:hypothetical protein